MYPNAPNVRRYEKIVRFSYDRCREGRLARQGERRLAITGRRPPGIRAVLGSASLLRRSATPLPRVEGRAARTEAEAGEVEDEIAEQVGTLEEADETAWEQSRSAPSSGCRPTIQNLVAALLRRWGLTFSGLAEVSTGRIAASMSRVPRPARNGAASDRRPSEAPCRGQDECRQRAVRSWRCSGITDAGFRLVGRLHVGGPSGDAKPGTAPLTLVDLLHTRESWETTSALTMWRCCRRVILAAPGA